MLSHQVTRGSGGGTAIVNIGDSARNVGVWDDCTTSRYVVAATLGAIDQIMSPELKVLDMRGIGRPAAVVSAGPTTG